MRTCKQVAAAVAVAASFATTANGQSVSTFDSQTGIRSGTAVMMGDPDTRIFDTMRSAERSGLRATETKPIDAAELARARASGEIRTTEAPPGTPQEIIRLQTDSGNSRPQVVKVQPEAATVPSSLPAARASGSAIEARPPSGAIVRLNDPQPAGRPQLTEARRAAEHASYEANKRRASRTASEQARARVNEQSRAGEMHVGSSAQSRAEVSSSELARSGITVSERATAARSDPTPRTVDRAMARDNAGMNDEKAARDVLSGLR